MAQNEPKSQLKAEGNVHLQKQPTPQWQKPRLPLLPLRRPRATFIALKLMYPCAVRKEDLSDVPAPGNDLLSPGPMPVMYSLWNSWPLKESCVTFRHHIAIS
jgi:hypothetical protein